MLEAYDDEDEENPEDNRPAVKHRAADFPKQDLTNPSQFRAVVQNIANVRAAAVPQEVREGREWYPRVYGAVSKGVRRSSLSHWQGAGLVAAVSPSMDFEDNNIHALPEMLSLKQNVWDAIARSAQRPKRSQEARDVLNGLSISRASDSGLWKAHRIIRGEDPNDVMPVQTNPKTNSFARAIEEPENGRRGLVTVDGRAHDLAQNEMWPWMYSGRGISSADLPSSRRVKKNGEPAASFGRRTRYEQFSDAYHAAADAMEEPDSNAMQAITWITGKRLERSFPTKSGQPRVKGVSRRRQPYPGQPSS